MAAGAQRPATPQAHASAWDWAVLPRGGGFSLSPCGSTAADQPVRTQPAPGLGRSPAHGNECPSKKEGSDLT